MNSGNLQQKSLWTRISHALLFCMNVLFFFLFFSLSFSAVFRNKSVYPCIFFIQLAAACAVTLLVFSAFVLFFLFKSRLPFAWERILQHETIFVAALFLLILTVQVVIVCSTYTSVGWDVAIVMEAATADVTYNHWDYFSVYPNNFLLFMLYRLVYSTLGKFLDIWLAMDLINILFVDAALLLGFFCAKKCFGRRTAYIVLGLSVLLFGFSPWLIIPYSDTLAMPFPIGVIACWLCFLSASGRVKKVLFALLAGILAFVGYLIKPSVVVVLVAAAIIGLVCSSQWRKALLRLSFSLLATAVFLLGSAGWNVFLQEQPWMPLNLEWVAPPEHFFMMGLFHRFVNYDSSYQFETYGDYNPEDIDFTFSFSSLEERKAADLDRAFERIRAFGPAGYVRFLFGKAQYVTADGVFYWGREGYFADFSCEKKNGLQQLFYTNGSAFPVYRYAAQGLWLFVLCLTVVPFLWTWHRPERSDPFSLVPFLRCSILGILFFILLFEGRSRYLILYLPCFSLLAGWALSQLSEFLQKRCKRAFPPRTLRLPRKNNPARTLPGEKERNLYMFKKLFTIALAILLFSGCGASSSGTVPDLSSLPSDERELPQPQSIEGIVERAEENVLSLRTDDGELLVFTLSTSSNDPELTDLLGGETVRISYLAKADGENHLISLEILQIPDRAEEALRSLLASMTLEEKVAQKFWVRCPEQQAAETVSRWQIGGYILFGRDFADTTPDQLRQTVNSYQQNAKIPLLIGIDEEGGRVVRASSYSAFRASAYPSPQQLYAQGGLEAIVADATDKAAFLLDLGVNVNLAPVCDLSTDPSDYIYSRSLGQDAPTTALYAKSVVQQMNQSGIGCVLKHFPGYGPSEDTHLGFVQDDRPLETFQTEDFLPFQAGIDAGAPGILVSHNIVSCLDPSAPASLSPAAHQLLREQLGFRGVIMTDDLYMGAIREQYGLEESAVLAVQAGNDLLISTNFETQIPAVVQAVQEGKIPQAQIDASVLRILQWKQQLGLLDKENAA